jgi:peptidoglycan/xylan/chitin deacetylase (PgdA/CDA1 family)
MYHALGENASLVTTPTAVFGRQMRWLYEHNYQVMPLIRLVGCVRNGDHLPPRSVVITFDDGFESVYTHAYPILATYGFPATTFLVAGYCDGQNDWPNQPPAIPHQSLLTWDQIREMDQNGIEFGAHSISHPFLDRLSLDEMEHEILYSKASIEDQLGHAITLFAYPYGRYTASIKAIVGRKYDGACTTQLGMVGSRSDPLELERIEAHYLTHPSLFRGLSRAWFPTYLGFRRLLRTAASAVLRRPWK